MHELNPKTNILSDFLLNYFYTGPGKLIALSKLFINDFLSDEENQQKVVRFLDEKHFYFLSSVIIKKQSRTLFSKLIEKNKSSFEALHESNIQDFQKSLNEFNKLLSYWEESFKLNTQKYDLSNLFEYAAEECNYYSKEFKKLAEKEIENSLIYENKSAFELAKRSDHTASFYKKISLIHKKTILFFINYSIKFNKSAIDYFHKANSPIKKIHAEMSNKSLLCEYVFHKKGINQAFKTALKNNWYKQAAFYATKKNDDSSSLFLSKHENSIKAFALKASESELNGNILVNQASSFGKTAKKYLVKANQNNENFRKNKNLISFFKSFFFKFRHNRFQKKQSDCLFKANSYFKKARDFYILAENDGKIAEYDLKLINLNKDFEILIKEIEISLINGNTVKIYELERTLKVFMELCREERFSKTYINILNSQLCSITKITRKLKQADSLEMQAENSANEKKSRKMLFQALKIYEEYGLFKQCEEIALKLEKPDIAGAYKKVSFDI